MIHRHDGRFGELTGRGVSVAVLDSGYHPGHPHLGPISGGVSFTIDGERDADLVDRLGHGTAVTAAIQEKAPQAEIQVVRIFHDQLATSARTLAAAIDWASENECRLANLSLGTPHEIRVEELGPAIERAVDRGTIVVSAYEHEGARWLPGTLAGALGVVLDSDCPRDAVRVESCGEDRVVVASGFPRPIPGIPVEKNLSGISFAVANATGMLALILEEHPDARTSAAALDLLTNQVVD